MIRKTIPRVALRMNLSKVGSSLGAFEAKKLRKNKTAIKLPTIKTNAKRIFSIVGVYNFLKSNQLSYTSIPKSK